MLGPEASAQLRRMRLIATDLDGTLLRADGTVSPRTRAALAGARAAGLRLVAVTARPPRFVRQLAAAEGLGGLAICCNGALVYDLEGGAVVRHTPLVGDTAARLVAALRAAVPGVCFAVEAGERYGWEPAYAALDGALDADDAGSAGRAGDALDLCAGPITKLIVRHADMTADA